MFTGDRPLSSPATLAARRCRQREAVAVSSNGTLAGYFVSPREYEELRRLKGMRRIFDAAELRLHRRGRHPGTKTGDHEVRRVLVRAAVGESGTGLR